MTTCTVTLTLVLAGAPPSAEEVEKALERTRRMRVYQRELMRRQRSSGAGKREEREAVRGA